MFYAGSYDTSLERRKIYLNELAKSAWIRVQSCLCIAESFQNRIKLKYKIFGNKFEQIYFVRNKIIEDVYQKIVTFSLN